MSKQKVIIKREDLDAAIVKHKDISLDIKCRLGRLMLDSTYFPTQIEVEAEVGLGAFYGTGELLQNIAKEKQPKLLAPAIFKHCPCTHKGECNSTYQITKRLFSSLEEAKKTLNYHAQVFWPAKIDPETGFYIV